jgi:hypothetical protein
VTFQAKPRRNRVLRFQNPVGSRYPGRRRCQAAFEKGYKGTSARCPYHHPKLIEIWKRGVLRRQRERRAN